MVFYRDVSRVAHFRRHWNGMQSCNLLILESTCRRLIEGNNCHPYSEKRPSSEKRFTPKHAPPTGLKISPSFARRIDPWSETSRNFDRPAVHWEFVFESTVLSLLSGAKLP